MIVRHEPQSALRSRRQHLTRRHGATRLLTSVREHPAQPHLESATRSRRNSPFKAWQNATFTTYPRGTHELRSGRVAPGAHVESGSASHPRLGPVAFTRG